MVAGHGCAIAMAAGRLPASNCPLADHRVPAPPGITALCTWPGPRAAAASHSPHRHAALHSRGPARLPALPGRTGHETVVEDPDGGGDDARDPGAAGDGGW